MALPTTPDGVCVIPTIDALCLRVNWGIVDGASSYRLFRSEVPHDGFCQVAHGIDGLTHYDDPKSDLNLNLRNVFYYRVSAENLDGLGPWSAASTIRPYGQIIDTNQPLPGLSWTDALT